MSKKQLSEIIPARATRFHEEEVFRTNTAFDYGVPVINRDWSPEDKASALSNFCQQLLEVGGSDISLFALWVNRE